MGKKESIEDTARCSARYDGIEFAAAQSDVFEELAEKAGVGVWNGLTDMWHPPRCSPTRSPFRRTSTTTSRV